MSEDIIKFISIVKSRLKPNLVIAIDLSGKYKTRKVPLQRTSHNGWHKIGFTYPMLLTVPLNKMHKMSATVPTHSCFHVFYPWVWILCEFLWKRRVFRAGGIFSRFCLSAICHLQLLRWLRGSLVNKAWSLENIFPERLVLAITEWFTKHQTLELCLIQTKCVFLL